MAKPKRKLTAAQKSGKSRFMTIFINGKQKRVRRPVLIDGLEPDDFYLTNTDAIALHQDGRWESIAEAAEGDIAIIDANEADIFSHSG
jgi:hypothetical protein